MVRHGCIFDSSGSGTCITGDCGGKLKCDGVGGAPPASLAEFTLDSQEGDFYDVSLVDGYNLPVSIFPTGGSRQCKSACMAFYKPEYCCTGDFNSPKK
ncbi:hypothetical protein AAZX31_09G003500 [Glycine max]|nr:hypothetical protein JHK87_023565 [Glycine soja]